MTSNDKYALNWDNHTKHIKRAFDALRKSNEFVDVTLCCEGKKLKAHKMVLSACSTYFHDLLTDNPCAHPIIILRDISYKDMLGILEFMYVGEAQVPTENFSSFLRVAELLKVSGLAEDINGAEDTLKEVNEPVQPEVPKAEVSKTGIKRPRPAEKEKKRVSVEKEEKVQSKKRKEVCPSPMPVEQSDDVVEEIEAVKSTPETSKTDVAQNMSNVQKLLSSEDYLIKESNPENECPICAQKFTTMYLLQQHIPFHLGETKCEYCPTVFNRKDLLKKHLMAVHKKPSLKKD